MSEFMRRMAARAVAVWALGVAIGWPSAGWGANWQAVTGDSFAPWQEHDGWSIASDVKQDGERPRRLVAMPGSGVLVSMGDGVNLKSRDDYQDMEVRLEFMVPKGSNAGVKLAGLYEIQILDSYGVEKLTGNMCGGVYPRADIGRGYRYLDDGVAPRVNASRPAGEWQTLEIGFVAPRFDGAGKKTSNAKFTRVALNGQVIHENVDLPWPTGAAWRLEKEVPCGPLLLQGNHGPVAFRKVEVRVGESDVESTSE